MRSHGRKENSHRYRMTSQISYTEMHAHTDFLEAMTEKASDTSLKDFQ